MLFLFTKEALACTVCGFGQDGTQWAYIFTTGFMTAMPFVLVGGIGYFLYRKSKR